MDLLKFLLCCVLVDFLFVHGQMARREEQWINIKFLTKSGKNATEVWRALRDVYRDEALSYPQVRLWHKCFKDGRDTAKDNPCSG